MTHASIAVRPFSPQYFSTRAVIDTDNTTEAPPSDESPALLGDQRLPDDRSSIFVQQTQQSRRAMTPTGRRHGRAPGL